VTEPSRHHSAEDPPPRHPPPSSLASRQVREVGALFVKLGVIGLGGPAAHIALMRAEVVGRRRWMEDRELRVR